VSARTVLAGYSVIMGACAVALVAMPGWRGPGWAVVGALSVAAIRYGVHRNAPRRRTGWLYLAGAVAASTVASVAAAVLGPLPVPAMVVTAVPHAAMVPLTFLALMCLARSGNPTRDRAALVDALTVTLSLALVVWVTVIRPYLPETEPLELAAAIGHTVAAVLLLALVLRLLLSRRRTVAIALLTAGAGGALAADLIAAAAHIGAAPVAREATVVGWLVFYAAWGAAALHPSMARLTSSHARLERRISLRRWFIMAATSLVGPVVLVGQAVAGQVADVELVAAGWSVVILLNLASVTDAANAHGRSLSHRERHDTLTGLANRGVFAHRLRAALARRGETGDAVGVMIIDLDEFTLLNDTLGQSVGDEILVTAARRLARVMGEGDLAARFGGDEFAVLVAAPAGPAALEVYAARVAAALVEPIRYDGRPIVVTASIGVAWGGLDDPGDDLLTQAGLALRAARSAGRGQYRHYSADVHGPMVERIRLREALTRAVEEHAFTLRYQPIVALADGSTVGFEALVRWTEPDRGPVEPVEFIALAEEAGLIGPIGEWVLRSALAAAARWHRADPAAPYVSVNVSAHQVRVPGFAARVGRELALAGLPPGSLMLELTESVLLREDDGVWAELAMLRDSGVRLALDDFGTGYSSLSYLVQTPIDVIKIDKSFIRSLSAPRQRVIVDGVVRLAATLGLRVVAEGIESPGARDLLGAMGCPYGQGYLYSVPLTGPEAFRWICGERTFTVPAEDQASAGTAPASRSASSSTPLGT
jgi:diguanylate cyclase (GGDEF)-like protein